MTETGKLKESASQTAGPYVHIGCVPSFAGLTGMYGGRDPGAEMVTAEARGARIVVEGRVLDGEGAPVRDALIEIWQADAQGLYHSPAETRGAADPGFTGWGRQPSDAKTGQFRFETLKPGQVPWAGGQMQAPHISVWIVARGINLGLSTRIYFSDEAEANATDPLLQQIGDPARVATMIADKTAQGYSIEIRLQGENETVFLDV